MMPAPSGEGAAVLRELAHVVPALRAHNGELPRLSDDVGFEIDIGAATVTVHVFDEANDTRYSRTVDFAGDEPPPPPPQLYRALRDEIFAPFN